jgi:ribose/xylose/arabinose/galactoside ABC-type transport system permease subunit
MAAIARVLSRAFPDTHIQIDVIKQLVLFCAAGLLVSLLLMTYGLDLSVGFF